MKSFKEIWPIASLVLNVILIVILLSSGSLFVPSANVGGQAISKPNLEKSLENSELTDYEKYAVNEIIEYVQKNKINLEEGQVIIRESTNGELIPSEISINNELPLEWVDYCTVGGQAGPNGVGIFHYDRMWDLVATIPYFY